MKNAALSWLLRRKIFPVSKKIPFCLEESYCFALLFHKVMELKKLVTPLKITSFHWMTWSKCFTPQYSSLGKFHWPQNSALDICKNGNFYSFFPHGPFLSLAQIKMASIFYIRLQNIKINTSESELWLRYFLLWTSTVMSLNWIWTSLI